MKEGLIYISDRLGQLRYSDKDDKIKWLQPLSSYKALVEIKRGQAVSVATLKEIEQLLDGELLAAYKENPSPYIVPTNTKIHNRCIGLALETVEFGADVHILGSGQFEYITDNSNEYNPGFTDDDISKKVYVSNMPGELTTDSEVAYKEYNNIIQIGHIIDAPNPDASSEQKKILLEVQIQGDDRGILESTQFEAVLGENVYISKNEPLTVFAFGQEEASKFKLKLCTRNMTEELAQEELDASFIVIKKLSGEYSLIKFSNKEIATTDITDLSTLELLRNRYKQPSKYYEIGSIDFTNSESSIEIIKDALNSAIKEMGQDLVFEESEYSPGEDFSSVTLELSENGGYYDIYISNSLRDFLRDTTVLQNGSLYNKNKAVLADVRIEARRNVFGVLVNKLEDDKLLKEGDRILLMRQGELVVNTERKLTAIGKKFVLGENGAVVSADDALRTADSSNTIGYLKKAHKFSDEDNSHYHFVIDIGENIPKVDYSTYPVGYLKPYYGKEDEKTPDFGYLVTNGTYSREAYKELYERLLGWYDKSIIDNGEDQFNIPEIRDSNDILMQIKYVTDGIFERLPKVPYLRDFGNISETKGHSCKIEDLDITALLSINTTFSEVDTLPLENLDIHLYIDPDYTEGEHNWREVYPGFYKYNNVDTYGFEWKIRKEPATEEDIYGKYILSADIGDDDNSRGIYYTSSNNIAPISCDNVPYKLYVAVKQKNIEHFDLRNLMSKYISSTVYNNNGEIDDVYAVTGEAVINAIKNNKWFKSLENGSAESVINFGGNEKLETVVNIQTNKAIRLNCSVESDENAVLIGETIKKTEGNTTTYTTLEVKDGKAFLNKLNTFLFELNNDKDFVNDGKEVATINDVLDHALMSIDGSSDTVKKAIKDNNNNDKGVIHGMIFGKGGNVDASTLCNYNVGIAYGQEITNYDNAIVSLIHKDVTGVHTPLQGNIDYYTNLNNDKSTKLFTLLPNYVTEDGILNLAFTKDNEKVDKISFDTATIVANTESPSLSRYKTIYEENKINDGRFTTELDEGSIPAPDDNISFDFAYILQAAYELPLAYWKYRNSDEYNIGPIIERLQDTINYFEKKDSDIAYMIDGDKDPYKYNDEQKSGIAKSLKDIISESGKSVRADDMVGFLLAAAGETQKRLAKLERSTYGRDVMEGKIIEFDNMPDVTPDHTKYGLNRLVRAICLELFQTADPGKLDVDENTKTSLSRIDDIEKQIRGSKKTPDSTGSVADNSINNLDKADDDYSISSSYPYGEDIENDKNAEAIKNEDIFKVNDKPSVTLTKETIFGEVEAKDPDSFNGVVDAIYRITQKVDVLTEAINGTNDILQPHTTLNKIKRNIETLIREVYFDGKNGEDAYKDILGKGETFNEINESRVDKITEDLYTYRLEYENCGDDQDLTSSEKLDKYNYPNASYNSDINKFDIVSPENINEYESNLSIIDIILKAIGNQILLKHYDKQNSSTKNLRFNKDISDRLYSIEQCLDKVVLRLKDNTYFEDFTKTDFKYDETTTLNLDDFNEALSKLLGYTPIENPTGNPAGKDKFKPSTGVNPNEKINSGKFSAEYALRTKSNIVAGLENILYRVQNEEKDNLHIKNVLGEELMKGVVMVENPSVGEETNSTLTPDTEKTYFNLSDDIKDLLATIYGEKESTSDSSNQISAGDNTYYKHRTISGLVGDKKSFLHNKNIIENIVNELYYIPRPFNSDYTTLDNESISANTIYVNHNDNVDNKFFTGSLIDGNNREKNFDGSAGRKSRLDILEDDVKALRKFIGLAGILDDGTDLAAKNIAVTGDFLFNKNADSDDYGIVGSGYTVSGNEEALTSSFIESFFNLMKRVDAIENTNTSQGNGAALEKDDWSISEGNLNNKQNGTDVVITLTNFEKFRYLLPDSTIAQEYYNVKGENDAAFCNATKVDDTNHSITLDMKNTTSISIYVTDFEAMNIAGENKVYKPFIYTLSRDPIVTFVTEPTDVASSIENFNDNNVVTKNTSIELPDYSQVSLEGLEGYTFDGWYQGDTKLVDQEKYLVDDDVTLTAKFKELDKHTVTYITDLPQDITVNNMPEDGVVYHGSAIQKPETDPLAEGYKFTGWYIGENEVSYPHTVESDIEITAKFTITTDPDNGENNKGDTPSEGGENVDPPDTGTEVGETPENTDNPTEE